MNRAQFAHLRCLIALFSLLAVASAENFAGGFIGVSTLSADATTVGTPPATFSAYKPENGFTAMVFGGCHITDWFSIQASYGWNRNSVNLSGGVTEPLGGAYNAPVRTTMQTVAVEGMLYFLRRDEWIRPYLSAGPGLTVLNAKPDGAAATRGSVAIPSTEFKSTGVSLRVAVGIDLRLRSRLSFRYSFSETIQGNALSKQLVPRGNRNLANFQNLWGFVWTF